MKKSLALLAVAFSPVALAVSSHSFYTQPHLYELTQTYDLAVPKGSSGETKLWIPLPSNSDYQAIKSLEFDGNYQNAYITENNQYGAKTLFATWDDKADKRDLTLKLVVETRDREPMAQKALEGYQVPDEIIYGVDVQPYLKGTEHIKIDGIVKEYADKIVGDEKNPLIQARLIHEWIVANMERDNSVLGCGDGDVEKMLTSGKLSGKCTDINSVFVALARAVGIPAREVFGIRLGQPIKMNAYSKTAFGKADANGIVNVNVGQHCRAEFYLAGFGWLPVDSADVAKMRLEEKKSVDDEATKAVSNYLFGNWEMNWMGFNHARDFDLYPQPELTPINNFGYPYAEVGGDPLNSFDADEFKYEYISKKLK